VSAIFTMDERGAIVKAVTNDRFRKVKGNREPTPWTAHYRNYQEVHGMMIPGYGNRVEFHRPVICLRQVVRHRFYVRREIAFIKKTGTV